MVRCNTGPGYNGGPCGPAPCTGECQGTGDDPRAYVKACGCISIRGEEGYDIHDAATVNG